jgi:hypothetical protein
MASLIVAAALADNAACAVSFGLSQSLRSDWIGTEALSLYFDAFSLCEPVSTSLENALTELPQGI